MDDILATYRKDTQIRRKPVGLKLIFVPSDFDADKHEDRLWLHSFLRASFSQDLAFGIVFGGFSKHVLQIFMDHGGPFGLKYAVLHEIAENGLVHNRNSKTELGAKPTGLPGKQSQC